MRHQHTLMQGYNAQAVVTAQQIIVGQLVTQTPVDHHLLHPSLAAARDQLTAAGIAPTFTTVLADAGYANEDAFARAEADGVQLLAPLTKDDHRRRGIDPAGTADLHRRPATARAIHALRTPHGRQQYELRGRTVEPVFGQIKNQQRARQFSRRGLRACQTEWALICTAHNLRKLHRHRPND